MESEKVKEIKKVLEEGWYNTITHYQEKSAPIKVSFADILTLINELESENERLIKALEDMPIPFMGCMLENQLLSNISKKKDGEIKALKDRIVELESKKEKLKQHKRELQGGQQDLTKRISALEKGNEALSFAVKQGFRDCQTKTLKQFAEKLKEKIVSMKWAREDTNEKLIKQGATIKAIDETLKEFIDE